MEEKEVRKDLKIPANASDRDDFVQGIGPKEVYIILISLVCIVVITIIFYVSSKNMVGAVMNAFFLLAATIMTVKRDSINENLIDKIKILIRYVRMQKKYEYVQEDVFNVTEEESAEKW